MNQADTDDPIEALDEIEAWKDGEVSAEKARHDERMDEIESEFQSRLDRVAAAAEIDEITALAKEIEPITERYREHSKRTRKLLVGFVTDHLSGSYEKEVTVKDDHVRQYMKKKRARIPASSLVRGTRASILKRAFKHDAPSHAAAFEHAVSFLEENRGAFSKATSVTTEATTDDGADVEVRFNARGYKRHGNARGARIYPDGRDATSYRGRRNVALGDTSTAAAVRLQIEYKEAIMQALRETKSQWAAKADEAERVADRLEQIIAEG